MAMPEMSKTQGQRIGNVAQHAALAQFDRPRDVPEHVSVEHMVERLQELGESIGSVCATLEAKVDKLFGAERLGDSNSLRASPPSDASSLYAVLSMAEQNLQRLKKQLERM